MIYTYSILTKNETSSELSKLTAIFKKFGSTGLKSTKKVERGFKSLSKPITRLSFRMLYLERKLARTFDVKKLANYNAELKKVAKNTPKIGNNSFKSGSKGTGSLGSIFSKSKTKSFLNESFGKLDQQLHAVNLVQQKLAVNNGKVGYSLEQLQAKATSLQNSSIFGDESILENTTVQLLKFGSITGNTFDASQQAVLDMTSAMHGAKASGKELEANAIVLGKALQNPVANLDALSRSGGNFSDSQKKLITNLAETGRLSEAQELILKNLNEQYGGSSKALTTMGSGPLKQLKVQFSSLQEKIASGLSPVLKAIVTPLESLAIWMNENGEVIQKIVPWIAGFGLVIYGLCQAFKAYHFVVGLVKNITGLWVGVQNLLNLSFLANPITWIVLGIIALIAAIGYVVYKTKGWGEAWKHTVKGAKLLWESFSLGAKAVWSNLIDGIMIGLNKIMIGWYKFKNYVGIGDSGENRKMLAKLEADTNERKKAIREGYEKAAQTAVAASQEFLKAGQSIKWKDGKKSGSFLGKLKSKLSFGGAGSISGNLAANNKSGNNPLEKTTQTIAGGGSKQTHFNITIQKLQDDTKIFVGDTEKGIEDMGDRIQEILLRAINSVNQMQIS